MSINVRQRQALSALSSQSRPWSKIWRQPLESCRNLIPFKSYFQFRCGDRHLEFLVSNVARHRHCHILVGPGRKRGVAVGIRLKSLCHWKLKFYRLAENNIRFFHVRCPWFSRSLSRYWKEQHSHGERRNMRNWTFWKQVFDLIFKFTRQSQKYLKRFAHTPTPALRRLLNCLHATNAKDGDWYCFLLYDMLCELNMSDQNKIL